MAWGSKLQKLLDFPAFLLGIFFLYWSVPLSVLQGKIQFWNLTGKRDDAHGWATGLQALFGIQIRQLPGPELYKGDMVIYLANHRGWADFFIDVLMTDGRAQMLSRFAVLFVFPAFMCCVWALKSVVLFKRGAKVDKEQFNDMIDRKMRESPVQGLIVYPEGHRSTKQESLPLKRGMLHYCYDRRRTAQIIVTANKEAVLSEKDLSSHFRQTILVGYAKPISPWEYDSFEAFMEAIQAAWDAEWKRVYSADLKSAFQKPRPNLSVHQYPASMKLSQVLLQGSSCLYFFVTLYWSGRLLIAFLNLFGALKVILSLPRGIFHLEFIAQCYSLMLISLQVLAAAILATWSTLSIGRALVPVQLPLRR